MEGEDQIAAVVGWDRQDRIAVGERVARRAANQPDQPVGHAFLVRIGIERRIGAGAGSAREAVHGGPVAIRGGDRGSVARVQHILRGQIVADSIQLVAGKSAVELENLGDVAVEPPAAAAIANVLHAAGREGTGRDSFARTVNPHLPVGRTGYRENV